MLFIEELYKTELSLTLTKIEKIPLNLFWVKEESLKAGTKDSQQ